MQMLDEIKSFASFLDDIVNEERLLRVSSAPEPAADPYEGSVKYEVLSSHLCSCGIEDLHIIQGEHLDSTKDELMNVVSIIGCGGSIT